MRTKGKERKFRKETTKLKRKEARKKQEGEGEEEEEGFIEYNRHRRRCHRRRQFPW